MIKLYIKTLLSVVVISCITLLAFYFIFIYSETIQLAKKSHVQNKAIFSFIQQALTNTPRSQLRKKLKLLQPKDGAIAKIVSIDSIKLHSNKQVELMAGKIVEHISPRFIVFGYQIDEVFLYQRIGNSRYAVRLQTAISVKDVVYYATRWMAHIVSLKLQQTPREQWRGELNKIQSEYKVPLKVLAKTSQRIPGKIQHDLRNNPVAYLPPQKRGLITMVYFKLPQLNSVLKIGPIQYAWWRGRSLVLWYSYIFIIGIIVVIGLTWLLSRNIRKIYQMTRQYSHANFSYLPKFSHFSILYGIFGNVVKMGKSLQTLIQSQHNMTRFIAHETRTPLATMQLALDSLKQEERLSDNAKNKLASIQEDIQALNTLIGHFLLYSQSATHEFKMNKQTLNMLTWLQEVIKRFQSTNINISLQGISREKTTVSFDSRLFKHVIDNLISNAIKSANQKVMVTLNFTEKAATIHIDDDGPGISPAERGKVFQPFVTLNTDETTGKHIGLGLAIAKEIVDLHHGSLVVTESPSLGGARFSIHLPL